MIILLYKIYIYKLDELGRLKQVKLQIPLVIFLIFKCEPVLGENIRKHEEKTDICGRKI